MKTLIDIGHRQSGTVLLGGEQVTEQVNSGRPTSGSCRDACLVCIYPTGPGVGVRHLLGRGPLIIGRGEDCDIPLLDPSVSRRHARIDVAPGGDGYLASDLGSTNGTFVNDAPAMGRRLADGDDLRVGNCLFRFLAGGNVEAEYHEQLYRLAIVDALTGLHNKRHLLECLERELGRSARHGRPLSLILFDIDHFKAINDSLGHLAGDLTLRELAACLQQERRRDELLTRYGGEEFAAVLIESTHDMAAAAAERFRKAVEQRPFSFEGQHYRVTISLGVASTSGGELVEPLELIHQADERLYRAKHSGRNRTVA